MLRFTFWYIVVVLLFFSACKPKPHSVEEQFAKAYLWVPIGATAWVETDTLFTYKSPFPLLYKDTNSYFHDQLLLKPLPEPLGFRNITLGQKNYYLSPIFSKEAQESMHLEPIMLLDSSIRQVSLYCASDTGFSLVYTDNNQPPKVIPYRRSKYLTTEAVLEVLDTSAHYWQGAHDHYLYELALFKSNDSYHFFTFRFDRTDSSWVTNYQTHSLTESINWSNLPSFLLPFWKIEATTLELSYLMGTTIEQGELSMSLRTPEAIIPLTLKATPYAQKPSPFKTKRMHHIWDTLGLSYHLDRPNHIRQKNPIAYSSQEEMFYLTPSKRFMVHTHVGARDSLTSTSIYSLQGGYYLIGKKDQLFPLD